LLDGLIHVLGLTPGKGSELLAGLAVGITAYCGFYTCASRYVKESKGRAWVLTCLTATLSTTAGAVVGLDALKNYWEPGDVGALVLPKLNVEFWVTETPLSKFLCLNFLSFLVSDVVMGVLFYAKHFHLLEGWVHHGVYIAILIKWYLSGLSPVFAFFSVEELPTLLLGLGTIDPRLRTDMGFGAAFFLTRLLWHIVGVYNACIAPKGHGARGQAWFGVVSLLLHLHWFSQWVSKYLIGGKKKKKKN